MANQGKTCRRSLIILLCLCAIGLLLWKVITGLQGQTRTQRLLAMPVTSWQTIFFTLKGLCQDQTDDSTSSQILSKELVVRRVYFDPRHRNSYRNTTVFLLETKGTKLIPKRFTGCQVGQHVSKKVQVRTSLSYGWVQKNKNTTSTLALVDCYNIPEVRNGESASLYYKTSRRQVVKVTSLKPLLVPEPRQVRRKRSATVVVCVGMIRTGEHSPSEHGILYHWLRYQKVIGVDHVHMYVENSFVRDGGLENEVIKQKLTEGYLSIDFWPNWLNFTEVYSSQKLAYEDCLYHFQGVYDYVVYADSDDFFVPVKKFKSIKHYLGMRCSGNTSTCRFTWRQYFPDCGWNPNLIGPNGNFTRAVTYKRTMDRDLPKSAHQLRALLDAGTHVPKVLLDGYDQARVPATEAYFAHIRFGWLPEEGC